MTRIVERPPGPRAADSVDLGGRTAVVTGAAGGIGRACAEDLGFVRPLLGGGQVPGFVEAVLGPVLEYDARRQTDLLRTLAAYFSCGGNLMRAKDRLRVGKLLGADWHAPERALELQPALRPHPGAVSGHG